MRIAMWSGPRNLSTAMMYSFGNRADCVAWDEPFFAAYLKESGVPHPLRDETIAAGIADPIATAASVQKPIPNGKTIYYQKHMPHHMLPNFPLDWCKQFTNIFLIRHPARVIASYAAKKENPKSADIGFQDQSRLFDQITTLEGAAPLIIDSADIRANPRAALTALCSEINIAFDEAMLSWPPGPKSFDGAWAPHWYNAVHTSTRFAATEGPLPELSGANAELCEKSLADYQTLAARKLIF
jgi:hypothetical protein